LKDSFVIKSTLDVDQKAALEHLFFFNVNQDRMRHGIQHSVESYGVPEIVEERGRLRIRVGDIKNVQTLFAISHFGPPVGVAVYVCLPRERFVVLHLVVEPRLRTTTDVNTPVLLELMREIRLAARRMPGVERIELGYNHRRAVRLTGGVPGSL
jgi:hypothetical protein